MLSSCFPAHLVTTALSSLLSSASTSTSTLTSSPMQLQDGASSVDLLVLGLGWTGSFLLPHIRTHHKDLSVAATTRDGRDGTLKWAWDSEKDGKDQYEALPRAKTVVVVFPLRGEGYSRRLVEGYEEAVGQRVRWIQLGSTGIFDVCRPVFLSLSLTERQRAHETDGSFAPSRAQQGGPTLASLRASSTDDDTNEKPVSPPEFEWTTRHSPYDRKNARAIAEDELLSLHADTVVLNLVGLWVRSRAPSLLPWPRTNAELSPWATRDPTGRVAQPDQLVHAHRPDTRSARGQRLTAPPPRPRPRARHHRRAPRSLTPHLLLSGCRERDRSALDRERPARPRLVGPRLCASDRPFCASTGCISGRGALPRPRAVGPGPHAQARRARPAADAARARARDRREGVLGRVWAHARQGTVGGGEGVTPRVERRKAFPSGQASRVALGEADVSRESHECIRLD